MTRSTQKDAMVAEIAGQLGKIVENLERLMHCDCAGCPPSHEGEKQITRHSVGDATIRQGVDERNYFILHGTLYDVNGVEDGEFEGVYQSKIFTTFDLMAYPESPWAPFDRPAKPEEREWNPHLNPTKAKWTFGDAQQSELVAVGPGLSRIAFDEKGGVQFWFGVTAFVTSGTGRYAGARGQATSLVSAHFPGTPRLVEGFSFPCYITHSINLLGI